MSVQTIRLPNGTEVKAQEVMFETVKEGWNEYALANGVTVRFRTVALKIFQILDDEGKPSYTAEGDPNILVRSENKVVTSQ